MNGPAPMLVMNIIANRLIWLGTIMYMKKPVCAVGASCDCTIAIARASNALTSTCLLRPALDRSGASYSREDQPGGLSADASSSSGAPPPGAGRLPMPLCGDAGQNKTTHC